MKNKLKAINGDKEKKDKFYKELEFCIGGIREIIRGGINRMNIYTV